MNLEQALAYRDNYELKVAEAADYVRSQLGEVKHRLTSTVLWFFRSYHDR